MKIRILLLLILISTSLQSQDGALDLEFGNGGTMITSFNDLTIEATSMVQQTDEKIVIVGRGKDGSYEEIVAARYLPNGELDSEFGNNGRFNLSLSNLFTVCNAVATDNFNNIYIGGYLLNQDSDFKGFVVKLDENGNIDPSFAQNGIWQNNQPNSEEFMTTMLIQPDGKILLAGKTTNSGNRCTVIRLNPNGTLDYDFGTDGYATKFVANGYTANFIKLDNDGDIITGGRLINSGIHIILVKFNQEGEIDSAFANIGALVDTNPSDENAFDVAIQDDNKIIVSYSFQDGVARDFGLVRYNANGTLDNSFGVNGRVLTDFSVLTNSARSIVLQNDQKIIQGGFIGVTPNNNFALVRFNPNGSLDTSFGDEGKTISDFGSDELNEMSILQSDGKLLCAGITRESSTDPASFLIARYITGIEVSTSEISDYLKEVNVYPNPASRNLNLSFELDISTITSIDLLNTEGRLIRSIIKGEKLQAGDHNIDVRIGRNIDPGMYFIKIQTENGSSMVKMMIGQ